MDHRKDLRYEVLWKLINVTLVATMLAAASNVINRRPFDVVIQPLIATLFIGMILYFQKKSYKYQYISKLIFMIFFNLIYLPIAWSHSPGISSAIGYYAIMTVVISVFFVERIWEMILPTLGIVISIVMIRLELLNPSYFKPFFNKTAQVNDVTINFTIVILLMFYLITFINRHYVSEKERFYIQAITDELTGVYNRRHILRLMEDLNVNTSLVRNYTCLFIDINNFKSINDTYGHHVGDNVLIELGSLLKKNFNVCGRFGGDEFVVLVHHADQEMIVKNIEILREQFDNYSKTNNFTELSLSIGVAVSNGRHVSEIIKEADSYMYSNKQIIKKSK